MAIARGRRAHSPWRAKDEPAARSNRESHFHTPQARHIKAHGEPTRHGDQESEGKGEEQHRVMNSRESELAMASNSLAWRVKATQTSQMMWQKPNGDARSARHDEQYLARRVPKIMQKYKSPIVYFRDISYVLLRER